MRIRLVHEQQDEFVVRVILEGRQSDDVLALLRTVIGRLDIMSQELDDLTREVEENNTVIGSAVALLEGLKAALDAAGTDPAALKALSDSLDTQSNALAAAVAANTPSAPTVP